MGLEIPFFAIQKNFKRAIQANNLPPKL